MSDSSEARPDYRLASEPSRRTIHATQPPGRMNLAIANTLLSNLVTSSLTNHRSVLMLQTSRFETQTIWRREL